MTATINFHKNCVGIAAPQTGRPVRLIVVDVSRYPRPHPNHGPLVLINPIIIVKQGKRFGREGCLSIPEFTGNVTRSEKISVKALDKSGKAIQIDTGGFEAVVLQHELDHLDGILFLDRITSLKTDVFRRKVCIDKDIKKG